VHIAAAKNDGAALRTLASDSRARYPARAQAAIALSASNATGLGSGELDVLASSTRVSAETAEKPYYVIARVKAAENATDPGTRARLLAGAVADDPAPIEPRLRLFRAYMQAGRFENALTVFRGHAPQDQVLDRAAIVRDIATAHRKSGHLEQARQFYRMLANLDARQDVKPELAAIEAELHRIQQDQRRMPHVHDNLDQMQRVRPRI
jgi:hypothetical protein